MEQGDTMPEDPVSLPVSPANDIVTRIVSAHTPTKALFLAIQDDPVPAIAILQQLNPEMVCFFLKESCTQVVESDVHPALSQLPKRWDWIMTPDTASFPACHKALAHGLGPLLTTWNVAPGELTIDLTSATPAMASAMTLVGFPFSTHVWLVPDNPTTDETPPASTPPDTAENPWDEEAPRLRQEACDVFNLGWHEAAAHAFRTLEHRVSGGLKPFYRALVDIAQGYGLWEQFLYRRAWEKLKSGIKALGLGQGVDDRLAGLHVVIQGRGPVGHIQIDDDDLFVVDGAQFMGHVGGNDAAAGSAGHADESDDLAVRIRFRAMENLGHGFLQLVFGNGADEVVADPFGNKRPEQLNIVLRADQQQARVRIAHVGQGFELFEHPVLVGRCLDDQQGRGFFVDKMRCRRINAPLVDFYGAAKEKPVLFQRLDGVDRVLIEKEGSDGNS